MLKANVFAIVDIRELLKLERNDPKFFSMYPIRDLIELLLTIPYGVDIDDFIWKEIETRFSVNELDLVDQDVIEIVIDTVDARINLMLSRYLDVDKYNYVFYKWIDPFTVILAREDKVFDGKSANELYKEFQCRRAILSESSNIRYRLRSRF